MIKLFLPSMMALALALPGLEGAAYVSDGATFDAGESVAAQAEAGPIADKKKKKKKGKKKKSGKVQAKKLRSVSQLFHFF